MHTNQPASIVFILKLLDGGVGQVSQSVLSGQGFRQLGSKMNNLDELEASWECITDPPPPYRYVVASNRYEIVRGDNDDPRGEVRKCDCTTYSELKDHLKEALEERRTTSGVLLRPTVIHQVHLDAREHSFSLVHREVSLICRTRIGINDFHFNIGLAFDVVTVCVFVLGFRRSAAETSGALLPPLMPAHLTVLPPPPRSCCPKVEPAPPAPPPQTVFCCCCDCPIL